jgi:hypothetical protein
LTAADIFERAASFHKCVGGSQQPTKFLSLTLKLLQLQPGDELIQEFISQDHFKYEWKLVYMDEFKHELLTSTANSCGIALPRLPFREALQQEGIFTRPAEANRLERSRPRGRRIGTISQI